MTTAIIDKRDTIDKSTESFRDKILRKCGESMEMKEKFFEKYADDIELHAFVDADRARQVRRLYWVQFEAYLPSRPELKHRYTSRRHVTLGGMDFFLDTWLERDSAEEPDSDGAHLDTLLRSAGYRLPKSRISVRLVHLMDDSRRELMYIYSEDTLATGFSADDLAKGGGAHVQWSGIEAAVIARAQRSIKFR